jgi:recombination protein RecT
MTDLVEFIGNQAAKFEKKNKAAINQLAFPNEAAFAVQQIQKSNFSMGVAQKNPQSVVNAINNLASIGLSLNPATTHAYLVPRDNAICLDISFKGLVKLATDCGAIRWAIPELVYETDEFKYRGANKPPKHSADVFSEERGELIGGYVTAKLPDGDYLVTHMTIAEIHQVRNTSMAYKKNSGPWVQWFGEMAKKTLIKRAYKSWPQTDARAHTLDRAVAILNEHEGTAYSIDEQNEYMALLRSDDALGYYMHCKQMDETKYIALYNSFAPGEKVKTKARADEMWKAGQEKFDSTLLDITALIESDDTSGIAEMREEFNERDWKMLTDSLPPNITIPVEAAA